MEQKIRQVAVRIERVDIPTYPLPEAEEMPMFSETSNHQGTTGNPYPVRATSSVTLEGCEPKPWTLITLENDYIRVGILPELGGRICEAYDKKTGYDFLYHQHVVKPAMIGVYGPWTSGGLEFNWPFHHRPSTLMPLDYDTEREADGTVIVWLSEHSPCDRTKGMVGIALRPDASYFETRAVVTNRTSARHSFLWWENAAVAVHEDYRLIFPPDVTWVHHHNDAGHTTFPIAQGQYGADNITEPKDISWHKNSRVATSYFAGPSKYDFFGGYDYRRECGVLHIADHHVSPGKKMFTWGYGTNAETWERKLTDSDGPYAELMAGSYTDDQPDFTWLAPYETKCFSQFWYPTVGIGYVTYANLCAAVALDREKGEVRVNATGEYPGARITVTGENGTVLLDKRAGLSPSVSVRYSAALPESEHLTVVIMQEDGKQLLHYTEEDADYLHIPEDRIGIPTPDELKTPMDIMIAGQHLDQYRSPLFKPDEYYLEALRREPDFLPAHKALGEYYTRVGRFSEALSYLEKAWGLECRYNQNPEDGQVGYLKGICLRNMGRMDEAYDALQRSAWSNNTVSCAMTAVAAIDGVRGEYGLMYKHAMLATEKEMRHPLAIPYAALAAWKLQDNRLAIKLCRRGLELDRLNHLLRYVLVTVTGKGKQAFYDALHSSCAQTCLDIAFDLLDAGFAEQAASLLLGALKLAPKDAMLRYTLAYCYQLRGENGAAAKQRRLAGRNMIVEAFPIRNGELTVLKAALDADETDGFAAYLLGCQVYNARMYGYAAELWERAVRYLPHFYIPYRNLALVYYNHLDRGAEAVELLKRAIELKPGDPMLLTEIAKVMQTVGTNAAEDAEFIAGKLPPEVSDQLVLSVAWSYNRAFMFQKAEEVMRSHNFSPAEGEEFIVAEPYMYACLCRGRIAMKEKRFEDALAMFRAAQELPDNLNVGFWNESVLIPYRYSEAEALMALGKTGEAGEIISRLVKMKNVGMWNLGSEFVYYSAMSVRLGGEDMRAKQIMRDAILSWEHELETGCVYHREGTGLFGCFVGDHTRLRLSVLNGMLGYGELFNGHRESAKKLFERSMELMPSNKVAFELELLK
ncbi:MAG: DUF5107 domain-containing protein [Clostridia bacterium]|nr:DUF5107 domain-containing protein [Clostridia bacterium]